MKWLKILKYGAAAMQIVEEAAKALADGKLTAEEGLGIIKVALDAADIKGLDVDLVEIKSRDDGGFEMVFPYEAIKDWTLDIDFD